MLEKAEDDDQLLSIKNNLAQNEEFMDEITKVVDGMMQRQVSTPINQDARNDLPLWELEPYSFDDIFSSILTLF